LSGVPTAPTAAINTDTTQIANTAFVVAEVADYAPAKDGTGAIGTWSVDISGNAATATDATNATNATNAVNATNATGTGTAVNTTATQTLTNKTLTSPVLTTPNIDSAQVDTVLGTAPLYLCRAWVNFNGTTSPGTIRASGNVSSVARNGTGDYTVNFSTAMPNANYAVIGTTNSFGSNETAQSMAVKTSSLTASATLQSTTQVRLNTGFNSALRNGSINNVAIFR